MFTFKSHFFCQPLNPNSKVGIPLKLNFKIFLTIIILQHKLKFNYESRFSTQLNSMYIRFKNINGNDNSKF